MMKQYTVKDFDQLIYQGINFQLSSEIIQILQNLEKQLNVPVTIKKNHVFKSSSSTSTSSEHTWKPPPDLAPKPVFKATQIEKKEGIEKIINQIRVALNKLSQKNYDLQMEMVILLMRDFFDMNETEPDENQEINTEKVTGSIFEIASSNKVLSELYAKLYKELIGQFPVFSETILIWVEKYKTSLHEIKYVDPKINYDEFCGYNKKNDLRKSCLGFLVNLMKVDVISRDLMFNIIRQLQQLVLEFIWQPNRLNDVEEITENIFLVITQGLDALQMEEAWNRDIVPVIETLAKCKVKEYASMSSRMVFKYQDLVKRISNL